MSSRSPSNQLNQREVGRNLEITTPESEPTLDELKIQIKALEKATSDHADYSKSLYRDIDHEKRLHKEMVAMLHQMRRQADAMMESIGRKEKALAIVQEQLEEERAGLVKLRSEYHITKMMEGREKPTITSTIEPAFGKPARNPRR